MFLLLKEETNKTKKQLNIELLFIIIFRVQIAWAVKARKSELKISFRFFIIEYHLPSHKSIHYIELTLLT